MDRTTLLIYLGMYLYGFPLMLWAIYYDKHPTKSSLRAAKIGLFTLSLTLLYFAYALRNGIN